MITFAELVEKVEHLSEDEMDELREILRKKNERELLEASKEALKEYEEGKTISLKSPEEIKKFFNEMLNDNN
jgi:hypothetical protein